MSAFLALGMMLYAAQTPSIPVGPVTLDEAAALAEHNAFAVRIQKTTVEKNRQEVKESQALLGPTISGNLGYTRYNEALTEQIENFNFVEQAIDSKTGGLALTLPIDISGIQRHLIQANKAYYRASIRTLQANLNDARLTARSDFLAILRAQAEVKVDEAALQDATERLNQAQLQYNQQEIAKIDLLAYQTTVDQAKSDLLNAQNSLDLARQTLNDDLAIPIETPVDVVEVETLPPIPNDVVRLVRVGQVRRPEVRSLIETLVALRNITKASESGMDPSLALGLSVNTNFDPLPGVERTVSSGTLTFSVPLYDSGYTRSKVRAARQDEAATRIQLEQTQLGISKDVRAAITNLTGAKARYDNAVAQVGYAQETYRLAVVKQTAGEGTYVEVIDAQNSLTQSKNGLLGARYDYLTAYAQLQRAVGADDLPAALAAPSLGGMK
jgi:outer membrane protein